jgi:hypothetical protein
MHKGGGSLTYWTCANEQGDKIMTNQITYGDRVKIIANTSNHGLPISTPEKPSFARVDWIPDAKKGKLSVTAWENSDGKTWIIYKDDYVPVLLTQDEIKVRIAALQKQVTTEEARLAFMVENNLSEFDDEEFKAYNILKAVESSETTLEKAKKIVGLFKTNAKDDYSG